MASSEGLYTSDPDYTPPSVGDIELVFIAFDVLFVDEEVWLCFSQPQLPQKKEKINQYLSFDCLDKCLSQYWIYIIEGHSKIGSLFACLMSMVRSITDLLLSNLNADSQHTSPVLLCRMHKRMVSLDHMFHKSH